MYNNIYMYAQGMHCILTRNSGDRVSESLMQDQVQQPLKYHFNHAFQICTCSSHLQRHMLYRYNYKQTILLA